MRTHIYPIGDLREHETDGNVCWCNPRFEEDGELVIHNAMDRREDYETGKLKPN